MHPNERYPDMEGFGATRHIDLPELPIPRPNEPAVTAPAAPVDAPGTLGGGASFTAAEDETNPPAATAGTAQPADQNQKSDRHFTWELAARLTAGMLANPGRATSSVKDAMGLFDQFLHEMNAYGRIASAFDRRVDDRRAEDTRRRVEHGTYFHGAPTTAAANGAEAPRPLPVPVPGIDPVQPRPLVDQRSGHQPRYLPGSMAGAPPPAPGADQTGSPEEPAA